MATGIVIEVQEDVAHVRLNRPEKLNALDGAIFAGLVDASARLEHDASVRAVVLSGNGRAFCAGLDATFFDLILQGLGLGLGLGDAGTTADRPLVDRTHGIANQAQRACTAWRDLSVPVIAAVHGACLGGGLQLALGADLRYAAHDALMSVLEIKWGLVPDMAGFITARGLVAPDVFRELVYTGRMLTGDEAAALGLATRACADPLSEALATARAIAGRSPDAIRAAKRLLNLADHADAAQVLLAESREQQALIGSPHQVEAIRAQAEKRAPVFAAPQQP
jgi:enoyl-CoA hydratase/carnithine racemase